MPAVSETIHLTLEDAAARVRDRRVSPAELTEACLARIEKVDPRLNAFVTVTAEVARAQAREATDEIAAGRYRGPLHGIPVAVKDLFATKGIRTTAGSRILADWVPEADATVVRKLREAGAVLLGKLGLHEFAYGISSVNPHFGDVRNPWDTTKIPGGSSGGSAVAVVAGEAYAALGSDTGGSIRIPASLSGCVGLKPTFGRASLFGAVPLAWSLDHPGPLARTVRDVAVAMTAIAGYDPRDPISADRPVPDFLAGIDEGPHKLRVGVPTDHVWDECDPTIATAVRAAIEALARAGAEILEIRWPRAAAYAKAASAVLGVEARAYHEGAFPGRSAEYGPLVRARLASQGDVDADTYARSMRLLLEAKRRRSRGPVSGRGSPGSSISRASPRSRFPAAWTRTVFPSVCSSPRGCGTRARCYARRARTSSYAGRFRCHRSTAKTATTRSPTAVSIGSPASNEPRTKMTRSATTPAINTRQPQPVTGRR